MSDDIRTVDAWGRVIISSEFVPELILKGVDVSNIFVSDDDLSRAYNNFCLMHDKKDYFLNIALPIEHSPEKENEIRTNTWFISDEIRDIDVRKFLISLCNTEKQISRVVHEMDLFEEKNLIPLLQLMIYLVDYFRQNNIVWGVGRGSSVSSYCLFLIGIHKIDAIKYDLDIKDFLK